MKLAPTQDRIIVLIDKREEKRGSLYVPVGTRDDRPTRIGTVLVAGPGDGKPNPYKPGHRVVFHHQAGIDVDHEGKTCRLLTADEVLAVVVDE